MYNWNIDSFYKSSHLPAGPCIITALALGCTLTYAYTPAHWRIGDTVICSQLAVRSSARAAASDYRLQTLAAEQFLTWRRSFIHGRKLSCRVGSAAYIPVFNNLWLQVPRCRYLADPGVLPVRDATRVQGKFCFVESREADKSTKNLHFLPIRGFSWPIFVSTKLI